MTDETYYPGDDPIYPVLGYWRTKPYREAIMVEKELVDFLLAHFEGDVDADVLRRTRRGDPDAPLLALWKLLEANPKALDDDDRATWLLLAAIRQKAPLPSRLLTLMLFERAAEVSSDRPEEISRLLGLAQRWNGLWRIDACTRDGCVMLAQAHQRYLRRFDVLAKRAGTSARSHFGYDDSDVGIPTTATLQVVQNIGDKESREGKELARAYASLTEPLPLKGGDLPPDTLAVILKNEFPWMADVIEHVRACLRLRWSAGSPWFWIRPTLLVGPPGVGKTRLAQRIARLVATGYALVSAAGSADNRLLQGTARGWSSAQPCLPILTMRQFGTANPVIIVDEVDKASHETRNGNLHATLLMMLEPESSRSWMDECLVTTADLSQVSWVLTANDLKPLPDPLRSRLTVIRVGLPKPEHFDTLLTSIRADIATELQIQPDQLPDLPVSIVDRLRDAFHRGLDPRRLRAAVERALAVGDLNGPSLN